MKKPIILFAFLMLFLGIVIRAYPQVMEAPPRDGIFDRINVPDRKPIPYSPLREADVVWQKRIWRTIDFRQKINQVFYYPEFPRNGWRNLMTVIMDAFKEGSITGYNDVATNDFSEPVTYEQVMKRLERTDTLRDQLRPGTDNQYYDTIIAKKFDPMMVKQLRIKEDWVFDKQRSQMDVRIIGICPVIENLDENGNFRGWEVLFWIYFPEARNVFAKAEVFNRFNDAERRTYDDIFWKRMFDSYIYKESNVYDRVIGDYARGLDALLESERIKNDIFKMEHDLWEF